MSAATDAIIYFVGLTVWSDQIPNDCGVKAILPRVVHTGSAHATTRTARPNPTQGHDHSQTAVPLGDVKHVQDHVAALVFYADSFDSQVGWGAPQALPKRHPNDDLFLHVPLDGDSVRFLTSGASNDPASLSGVRLPRLRQELCPAKQSLRAAFRPPYSGAAAVVALPEGTLQACVSLPADSPGRLDTRVKLQTNGTLVISASTMRETKELRLVPRQPGGPIEIMIANVPAPYYDNIYTAPPPDAIDGMSHIHAYYAMGEPVNGTCTKSVQEWWDELQDPDSIVLCEMAQFPASGPLDPQPPSTAMANSGANFECSNTQWP